jgi:diguanylate cyclase (GGDEF)-like protein/PAS domain S-box-containing protein
MAAVVLGLIALTTVTAVIVHGRESRQAEAERRGEAQRAAEDLRERLELTLGGLASVRGLFASSETVTGREYATFARTLLEGSPLSGTLLMSRVPATLRRDFESLPGAGRIRDVIKGRARRATSRDEYYPIAYRAGEQLPVGLDLSADPALRRTLEQARDSGRPRASPPISLPPGGRPGLLVFLPIYASGQEPKTVAARRAGLAQVAAASFEAKTLGDGVLDLQRPGTELQLIDGERVIYGPRGKLEGAVEQRVAAAGRDWRVLLASSIESSTALPATILGGGLAVSFLVGALLLMLGRRESAAHALSGRRLVQRLEAEQARRAAEQRFRRAFDDSGVGMALIGVEGKRADHLLDVNDALCELTGRTREELLSTPASSLVHPDDAPMVDASLRRLLEGSIESVQAEQRIVGADGQAVWVLAGISVTRDESGDPTHLIVQLQDVSERKRFEGQLQHLADHDALTGLFNRRRFEEELERELAAAGRYGGGGAVIALDLDHFKYINDSLGHNVGDELIGRAASLLRDRLRETDVVARLGGDEFAVILPRADERHATSVAEDLLSTIRSGGAVTGEHGRAGTTASAGVALFPEQRGAVSAGELLVEADVAMYDAKEAGRDRYMVYTTTGRAALMATRLDWVDRIRRALAEDRFVLHGQPILSLSGDGRPREELLLRMLDDSGDLIPPASFLAVAERFDLIQEIDRWVVRKAIGMLATLERAGVDAALEVNLSAKSVTDADLPAMIETELAIAKVNPAGLVLEMTETAAIVNVEQAKRFAISMRELGCQFALDDFGAGFASFYYLKHLAFDYLKIDGEFIADLRGSETNQLLVRALVDIARGMGKQTIAEYVGDAETLELLREMRVDYAQGFHVARPRLVDAGALADLGATEPIGA